MKKINVKEIIEYMEEYYELQLNKRDARSVPMKLLRTLINNIKLTFGSDCLHEHVFCPGDIKTIKCAYCGKLMYHEPKE